MGTTLTPILELINQAIERDERITAAWLAGSRGRGTDDELSDIDIWLAVENGAIMEINTDPLAFVHAIAPTIMHIPAPSIAPPGGAFVLTWIPVGEGFTQVDWYWTPASTASRPAQTKLLFERHPVPVDVPAAKRMSDDALTEAIDASISDALLLIAYAWKHARRGHVWPMLNSFRHTNEVLARLDWLITHGRVPTFDDPTRSFMRETVPGDLDHQRGALRQILAMLETLITNAGRKATFTGSINALQRVLES